MHSMTNKLFSQDIAVLRQQTAQQVTIEVVEETGSTNADLMARVGQLSYPVLLAAESQTAGRGRAGRTWLSVPGASLTFSLAWKFGKPIQELVGLPLAVGVAIAEALAQFNVPVQLKWPNDVLREGKKLAGILIETAMPKGAAGNGVWAIIGIGLNIAMPEQLAAQIDRPVADAGMQQFDRNVLLASLLNQLATALILFDEQGLAAFTARWNGLHAYAGKLVRIIDQGQTLHEGIAVGVDSVGRLLLETPAGHLAVMAGDVSLRVEGE
jgi:BirA family biotin operon repressor/biotin-[acetyl-CoA-carboxylase] ligase